MLTYKPPQPFYDMTKPEKEMSDSAILCELKRVQRDVNTIARGMAEIDDLLISNLMRGRK